MNTDSTAGALDLVDAGHDIAVDTRRAVHAAPELAFKEVATTRLIRERLAGLGFRELPCPTETGAVYQLGGGRPGRTVLLRADIDALPVTEEVDVPYRSRLEGQMHACGHDGHVAILLATAAVLAQR
ncbi:MAG TPA: M20/M25/M40 family metallo-hydrolase, partial [Candidatus Dormibacteraeota bacterium]|nr:M20/M25/M40 family metallo-hydrolase [Candidatus Dormibacteraeota bacterium]